MNDELLLDCFRHLGGSADPAKVRFRSVAALLLMRRKRLKFEDARKTDAGETFVLWDAKGKVRYEVPVPTLTDAEMDAAQDEVFQVLGWE